MLDGAAAQKLQVLSPDQLRTMLTPDKYAGLKKCHDSTACVAHLYVIRVAAERRQTLRDGLATRVRAQLVHERRTQDRLSATKDWAEGMISFCMGGRVAEELIFGHLTTGAGNDLEKATEMARKMVCNWGMSEKLGPLTFGKKEEHIFLGREIAQHQDYSEETAQVIDAEVKRIVTAQYARARHLVEGHLAELRRIAEALLEHETLSGDDIDILIAGGTLPYRAPARKPAVQAQKDQKDQKADDKDARPSLFGPVPVLDNG